MQYIVVFCLKTHTILIVSYSIPYIVICLHVFVAQEPDVKEEWNRERENYISQLQAQIQRVEQENTDFLAALEDAMEQYKQQVGEFM